MINHHYCQVCDSSISEWKRNAIDNQENKIDLCNDCGYAFINPRPTLEFISRISDEALLKRIPNFLLFTLPIVKILVSDIFDILYIGIMINIYARNDKCVEF